MLIYSFKFSKKKNKQAVIQSLVVASFFFSDYDIDVEYLMNNLC